MRIDPFNKVTQIYQANKPKKITGTSSESFSDTLEISRAGQDYQVAKAAVKEASDVRMDKVEAIREQMAAGTYAVTPEMIAEKLVGNKR